MAALEARHRIGNAHQGTRRYPARGTRGVARAVVDTREAHPHWGKWYAGILAGTALAIVIALSWAVPAALQGGPEYRHGILWEQSAHRIVNSFAHHHPVWWYLPRLPIVLFPWLVWPPLLRGVTSRKAMDDSGVRFCLAWLLPVLLSLCLISGKQVHYLLPLFPAFALLAGFGLSSKEFKAYERDSYLPATGFMLLGLVLLVLPKFGEPLVSLPWVGKVPPLGGALLIAAGMALIAFRFVDLRTELIKLASASALLVIALHFAVVRPMTLTHDVADISRYIKALQDAKLPVGHVGKYHAQYQFLGRLDRPLEVVQVKELVDWFDVHPDGRIVVCFKAPILPRSGTTEFSDFYRGKTAAILDKGQAQSYFEIPLAKDHSLASFRMLADQKDP